MDIAVVIQCVGECEEVISGVKNGHPISDVLIVGAKGMLSLL